MDDLGLTIEWHSTDALHRDWLRLRTHDDVFKAVTKMSETKPMMMQASETLRNQAKQYRAELRSILIISPEDEPIFVKLYNQAFENKIRETFAKAFESLFSDLAPGLLEIGGFRDAINHTLTVGDD